MREMFDSIPERYNLLNNILTFGRANVWRGKILYTLYLSKTNRILDICTGTGVLALKLAEQDYLSRIYAMDFSPAMLSYAKQAAKEAKLRNIAFIESDCIDIGVKSNHFDYVTISFGFRNLSYSLDNLKEALRE